MKMSPTGLSLIKEFEKCRLKAYPDGFGNLTIGWGHTGHDVTTTTWWTQKQADDALALDVQFAEHYVTHSVTVPLNQNEFDAVVDLVFNCGCHRFFLSPLRAHLNAGMNRKALVPFLLEMDTIKGAPEAGLARRRMREAQLWMAPIQINLEIANAH